MVVVLMQHFHHTLMSSGTLSAANHNHVFLVMTNLAFTANGQGWLEWTNTAGTFNMDADSSQLAVTEKCGIPLILVL